MATTAPGSPYVESSDLVANYPAVSEALAERVDTVGVLPFADSTARGTAIPSPTEGQYTYLQDTNATEYWDGSAWVAAGVAPGLVNINTTTFSAVSSVSLNDVFTSDYDYYRIILSGVSTSSSDTNLRLRASGTDATGGSDYSYQILNGTSSSLSAGSSVTSLWNVGVDSNNRFNLAMDIFDPFLSVKTSFSSMSARGGQRIHISGGYHNLTTSYDGFTLSDNAGTMTGTIRVYGYSNGA